MQRHVSTLSLALALFCVPLAAAAASIAPSWITPGSVQLDLSTSRVSWLYLGGATLREFVCESNQRTAVPQTDKRSLENNPIDDNEETRLVITNEGGGDPRLAPQGILVRIENPISKGSGSGVSADLRVVSFDALGGRVVKLECGDWSYRVTLDPAAAQPTARLTTVPNGQGGGGGIVDSRVAANLSIRFVELATAEVVTRQWTVMVDLTGPYAVDRSPATGQSNLVPFALEHSLGYSGQESCGTVSSNNADRICFRGKSFRSSW